MTIVKRARSMRELQERFPYMFEAPVSLEMYRGWFPIFSRLCADIDELLETTDRPKLFQWAQLKEKFGGARWAGSLAAQPDDDGRPRIKLSTFDPKSGNVTAIRDHNTTGSKNLRDQIWGLIALAEAKTSHACIACGLEGKNTSVGGWYLTLCDAHAKCAPRSLDLKFEMDDEA